MKDDEDLANRSDAQNEGSIFGPYPIRDFGVKGFRYGRGFHPDPNFFKKLKIEKGSKGLAFILGAHLILLISALDSVPTNAEQTPSLAFLAKCWSSLFISILSTWMIQYPEIEARIGAIIFTTILPALAAGHLLYLA